MFETVWKKKKGRSRRKDCDNGYTGNTDTYIPSKKDFEMLQMYIAKLMYTITSPVTLVADLFADSFISVQTRMKANNDTSRQETRNHHILDELMIIITIDPTNLTKNYLSVTKSSSISKCSC